MHTSSRTLFVRDSLTQGGCPHHVERNYVPLFGLTQSNVELRNYVPLFGLTQSNVELRNYVPLFCVTQSNVDLRNYVMSRQIVI